MRVEAGDDLRPIAATLKRSTIQQAISTAQFTTPLRALPKQGRPRRNLEKTTGANRVWSEGSL